MKGMIETLTRGQSRTPEQKLWTAVLETALGDAMEHKDPDEKDAARRWFMDAGAHFRLVCDMADFDPDYLRRRILRLLN